MVDGLIKYVIVPPKKLKLPVLPFRIDKKLDFLLCRTCAQDLNVFNSCEHSEDERILSGTWVMDEIRLALRKGYIIRKTIEIWEYKTETYNKDTKKDGIFME